MDNMSGRTLHVAGRAEYVSTLDLVQRNLRSYISLNERLLTWQRELVGQMDGLGIDTSRFKTSLGKFEEKQRQYGEYADSLLRRRNSGDGPQGPLKSPLEYALAPNLDNARSAPLLQGQAARRPRSLAESNAEAAEARARLKVFSGGQDKGKVRSPLVTEQGLRLNKAFLKIGSALFREAVTALAEELATEKTVEPRPKERLRLTSFAGIKDANLRRLLIELTEAIVQAKSRC
jgi:hypothetical protein